MFTTAMTIYAMNGQSLSEKVIGFNKYSVDRPWLDLENANAVGNGTYYLIALKNYLFSNYLNLF